MKNAIFARGLLAFQYELHTQSYTPLTTSSCYQATTEEEEIRTLVARGTDGLLLIEHDRGSDILRYLENRIFRLPSLST